MESLTKSELRRVAKAQKAIINLILVNLGIGFVVGLAAVWVPDLDADLAAKAGLGLRIVLLVLGILSVIYIFRLARALRRAAWIYAIAAFLPCISLVTLLLLNHYATQALRAAGLRVGLLGISMPDLEDLSEPSGAPPTLPD